MITTRYWYNQYDSQESNIHRDKTRCQRPWAQKRLKITWLYESKLGRLKTYLSAFVQALDSLTPIFCKPLEYCSSRAALKTEQWFSALYWVEKWKAVTRFETWPFSNDCCNLFTNVSTFLEQLSQIIKALNTLQSSNSDMKQILHDSS